MMTTNEAVFRRCSACRAWNELGDDYGECYRRQPVILQPAVGVDPTRLSWEDVLNLTYFPVTGSGEGCYDALPFDESAPVHPEVAEGDADGE